MVFFETSFHAKSYIVFFSKVSDIFYLFIFYFISIEMLSRHPNVITKMIVPIGLEKTINGS